MKLLNVFLLAAIIVAAVSCKKEKTTIITDGFSSTQDFFDKNGVALQSYTINGNSGGTFTSPQGTVVIIPANAFVTQNNNPVTGNVTIEFKDLFKKSDMLLSDVGTLNFDGTLLLSGGEFFIKAIANNEALLIAKNKHLEIQQPKGLTGLQDTAKMQAFQLNNNDSVPRKKWVPTFLDTVQDIANNYVYKMYQFNSPAEKGTWCNSDNSSYFSKYTQTKLTINTEVDDANVYLVFKNISSMVHVYYDYFSNPYNHKSYPYYYAPIGLECTIVAVKVIDGKLYASFTPIAISANQVVNTTLKEISVDNFKMAVKALD